MLLNHKKIIMTILLLFPLWICANSQYLIIIDAGSSGSRLHLFTYAKDANTLYPHFSEIFLKKTKPGIANFVEMPNQAANTLIPLLLNAKKILNHYHAKKVPLYLFATAGMRFLSDEQQQNIYSQIKKAIEKNTDFTIKALKTISGRDEGLFTWLAVNYYKKTIQTNQPTFGIVELGGASSQIAFVPTAIENQNLTVSINRKKYNLFSTSFLGLGIKKVRRDTQFIYCTPINKKIKDSVKGRFNIEKCHQQIEQLLLRNDVKNIVPPIPKNMQFYLVDKFYPLMKFYNILHVPFPSTLLYLTEKNCKLQWKELKDSFEHTSKHFLKNICFDGVYIADLLVNGYGFNQHTHQFIVTNNINGHELDWSLGAALYVTTIS